MCDNEIYGDIENTEEHFICDWSLQATAFISANKMKGIFNPSFPMSYCQLLNSKCEYIASSSNNSSSNGSDTAEVTCKHKSSLGNVFHENSK